MLYPLKFNYIIKEKVWGGEKLSKILNKEVVTKNAGESWEISAVKGNLSVVTNGSLKGKTIVDLINDYKVDFLGQKVYETFGEKFPLLIKFIDAKDDLSVQVHPNDEYAKIRHNENGKSEIWYIIDADFGAELILGVNKDVSKETYIDSVEKGYLKDIINTQKVKKGDVAYIPSGRIHAIKKGVFLAEIQQSSDLTYRIYDWDRKDLNGTYRELHSELAADVVDLKKRDDLLTDYILSDNSFTQLISNEFFTVNITEIDSSCRRNYSEIDSFVILMCVDGSYSVRFENEQMKISAGETILIPAILDEIELSPSPKAKFLEIYI